nr:hypothetical protein [Fuerstiella marisgermanici]
MLNQPSTDLEARLGERAAGLTSEYFDDTDSRLAMKSTIFAENFSRSLVLAVASNIEAVVAPTNRTRVIAAVELGFRKWSQAGMDFTPVSFSVLVDSV